MIMSEPGKTIGQNGWKFDSTYLLTQNKNLYSSSFDCINLCHILSSIW